MNDHSTTIGSLLDQAARRLETGGVEDARRQVEWMLLDLLGGTRAQLYARREEPVPPSAAESLARMVERRLSREPLQYVLGHTEFFGLPLRVSPAVLIPRPETEEVVARALDEIAALERPRVLDIGTGSGCIALAIASRRPDAELWACDVSRDALQVARENATALDLPLSFLYGDALGDGFIEAMPQELDLVVSNPPYITECEGPTLEPEVRDHEPALALFAGDDPLRFYRALVEHARVLLRSGGRLVFETHAEHAEGVADLMRRGGFLKVRVREDLAGRPRICSGRLPTKG